MVTPKRNWHDGKKMQKEEMTSDMVGYQSSIVPRILTKKSKHFNRLSNPCMKITEDDDIDLYKAILMKRLSTEKDGVGLALNQLGIMKSMALINVIKPVYIINPKIISLDKATLWKEGCLSFPGKYKLVQRHTIVEIKTMGNEGTLIFSGEPTGLPNDNFKERTLEAICVQHEIDHLNGETIYDVTAETKQTITSKVGRNEPCHCGSGKKYKRCCNTFTSLANIRKKRKGN